MNASVVSDVSVDSEAANAASGQSAKRLKPTPGASSPATDGLPRTATFPASGAPENAQPLESRVDSDFGESSAATAAAMLLPLELLEAVLSHLAPKELVECRRVCRRWRALVDRMEERDRRAFFLCGEADIVNLPQPTAAFPLEDCILVSRLRTMFCTCGTQVRGGRFARLFGLSAAQADLSDPGSTGDDGSPGSSVDGDSGDDEQMDDQDASDAAGPELDDDNDRDLDSAARVHAVSRLARPPPYRIRHREPLPPARWEVLRAERDLALDLARQAQALSPTFLNLEFDYVHRGGLAMTWVPCWFYLPDHILRPTTHVGLQALVGAFFLDVGDARFENDVIKHLAVAGATAKLYSDADAQQKSREYRACRQEILREVERRHAAESADYQRLREDFYRKKLLELYPHDETARSREEIASRAGTSVVYDDFVSSYPNGASIVAKHARFQADWDQALRAFDAAVNAGTRPRDLLPSQSPPWRDGWRVDPTTLVRAVQLPSSLRYMTVRQLDDRPIFDNEARELAHALEPSGWVEWEMKARQIAYLWRFCAQRGWNQLYRQDRLDRHYYTHLAALDDEQLTATLDATVAEVDRCRAAFEARCQLCVVVHATGMAWVGGLSPRGHIVGALTFKFQGD